MGKRPDLTGQKFGRLLVLEFAGTKPASPTSVRSYWRCRCDCGNAAIVPAAAMKSGGTRSCGCLKQKHGHTTKTFRSPTYRAWSNAIDRCRNPRHHAYALYGGRGIRVCDRWLNGDGTLSAFQCFLADMGERPDPTLTLDRFPDKDGNYEPGNCRWATRREQSNNTTTNHLVCYQGRTVTIAELARLTGVERAMLQDRIVRYGWPVADAVETPIGVRTRWSA